MMGQRGWGKGVLMMGQRGGGGGSPEWWGGGGGMSPTSEWRVDSPSAGNVLACVCRGWGESAGSRELTRKGEGRHKTAVWGSRALESAVLLCACAHMRLCVPACCCM